MQPKGADQWELTLFNSFVNFGYPKEDPDIRGGNAN